MDSAAVSVSGQAAGLSVAFVVKFGCFRLHLFDEFIPLGLLLAQINFFQDILFLVSVKKFRPKPLSSRRLLCQTGL